MNLLRLSVALAVCLALVAVSAAADEKAVEKDKLVGSWIVTKSAGGLPPEAVIQFTKDGKLKITAKLETQTLTIEGTYSIEKDKLTIALKQGAKEQKESMTIKTLTDTMLVTVDGKGKEDEFKKK